MGLGVRLVHQGALLVHPRRGVDELRQEDQRLARPLPGLVVTDVGHQLGGLVVLGGSLGDGRRQHLHAGGAEKAHDLLHPELLRAVVDPPLEVGLHPLRQSGGEVALGLVVADQRGLVRQEAEGGVLVGNARVGQEGTAVRRGGRRRLLHHVHQLGREVVDDVLSRVLAQHRESPLHLAQRRVVAQHQKLEADALAVARAHVDERERGLVPEGPGELVVGHDGVELLRAVLGRLPAMHVRIAHRARAGGATERTHHRRQGRDAHETPGRPRAPRTPALGNHPRGSHPGGWYDSMTRERNCFGKLTPLVAPA